MAIDDLKTVERLRRLVTRLTSDVSLREDLSQEALVHLWRIQQLQPGQTESWYLQNCRFHLQHHLAFGRSIDSPKRSSSRVHPSDDGEDHDSLLEICVNEGTSQDVLADVSARDMISSMSKWLPECGQTILELLANGFEITEIALRLNISHWMVVKHRRKIATLAVRLGIPSFPEYQRKPSARVRQINGEKQFDNGRESAAAKTINGVKKNNGHSHAIAAGIIESSVQLTII